MKTFDELVDDYDNALFQAEQKLPDPRSYCFERIQVPIMLEMPIGISEELPSTENTNILVFEFFKLNQKWELKK